MNETLRIVIWLAALISGLTGYFVVLGVLFPRRVERTRDVLTTLPGRSLGIGVVNFLFFSVIAFILMALSENAGGALRVIALVPAVLIIGALAVAMSFGLTGTVNLIGERALPEASALKRTVWGTIFLGLACALPLVGWFLLLPYVGLTGIGAFIIGFFQRESS